jgi:hypothetical protein
MLYTHDEVKCKAIPLRHAGAKRERMYSSYSFLPRHCVGVSGQRYAPAALYFRETTPVRTGREAGWSSELVWTQRIDEISFVCAGDRTPVVVLPVL